MNAENFERNSINYGAQNVDHRQTFSCAAFLQKYFLQGVLIPFTFCTVVWWSLCIKYNFFQYFPSKYFMSITMVFGGTIAGATAEGGGAVAFPVMTMAFNITPSVARDFSLMIQTCGMSAASFGIIWMNLQLEYHSIMFCFFGGVLGMILGFLEVDHRLTGAQKKMGFVAIFFAFAIALFILNRQKKRRTFSKIPEFSWWKAFVLFVAGILGGTLTAVTGSGLDICSFSVITLLFHVSEKVATPTSVVLMAGTSCVGLYIRHVMLGEVSQDAWEFLAVCAPIVVFCAPFGSFIASHFHRQVLACMLYVLETVALIAGFVVVKPSLELSLVVVGIIVFSTVLFLGLSKLGCIISSRVKSPIRSRITRQIFPSFSNYPSETAGQPICDENQNEVILSTF